MRRDRSVTEQVEHWPAIVGLMLAASSSGPGCPAMPEGHTVSAGFISFFKEGNGITAWFVFIKIVH